MSQAMRCVRCRQDNPEGARFCNQCGAPLAPTTSAPELRRLTILFCDLVGSVELANRLDPEDWHALLGSYQDTAADAIRRHHGHVAQRLGDGLVAYFGYPVAAEDDAVSAVRAALELVQSVGAMAVPSGLGNLRVRVGLHTGPTTMGQVGGSDGEYLAIGDTPNIAARIQALAPENAVLLGPATRTLVERHVQCSDLGEFALKGLAAPLRLHRAIAWKRADVEDRALHGPSPFLGRAREFGWLWQRWEQAAQEEGRCVLLLGEPGIGKSRLAREARSRARLEGADAWTLRCSAHAAHTPFAPLANFLRQAMIVTGGGEGGQALDALLAAVGVRDEAVAAPLRALLAIDAPAAEGALSAQALRERTFDAAITLVHAMAARRRSMLVVEDLHWADPTTLEWLGRLLQSPLPRGVLLVLLARTEFEAPWGQAAQVERLAVEPCSPHDALAMVAALDAEGTLGATAIARIVQRAEGNPLFLEEFTRSALEARGDDVPLTLHDQTTARLDRLGPAKQVLQHAAVIGHLFSHRQLAAASGLPDEVLALGLKRGLQTHMLRTVADAGGEVYAFRHALLRDAAYASLLRSTRQASHARVAEAILADDPDAARLQPELLAHHYTEAGQVQPAIGYWLAAAKLALARSACVEAATHVRTALGLLGDPGENAAALATELELRLVLAPALMAYQGVLDPEVEQTYARARWLCERLGNSPKLLVPLWGLWAYELMRGEIGRARELSQQLRDILQGGPQPVATLVPAATTGMTLFYAGDLRGARDECAKGLGMFRMSPSAARGGRGVHDPGVMCHTFHTFACWLLGDGETAAAGSAALRDTIPALPPFDAAYAWCSDALLHTLAGDPHGTCHAAELAIAIGREQAFPAWQMMGTILHGWGRARQGDTPAAIAQMRRAYDAWCASGARNLRPLFLSLLADAWLADGKPAAALECADHGLAEASTGEHCWDPELHRLRGEALAALGRRAEALESVQRAIAVSLDMGARPWGERAQASHTRLAGEQAACT